MDEDWKASEVYEARACHDFCARDGPEGVPLRGL